MSVYRPEACFSNPARLILGPTNLSAGYPYGGQPLGIVTKAVLVKSSKYGWADSEALGLDRVQGWRGASWAVLNMVLEQYDPTLLDLLWDFNTATGPNGYVGANVLTLPKVGGTNVQPGPIVANSTLLVAADDPQKPSMLIYSPLWNEEERQKWAWQLNVALESVVSAVVGLDSANRTLAIDRIENLSL